MKNLRAKILQSERDGNATVICPYCDTTQVIQCQSMDEVYKEQCFNCHSIFKVDLNHLMKSMHWIGKIPINKKGGKPME